MDIPDPRIPDPRLGEDRRVVLVDGRVRLGEAMAVAAATGWHVLSVQVLSPRQLRVVVGR